MTRKPSGPIGQMEMEKGVIGVPQVGHITCKPLGPTGQMEIEKGVVGSHKLDGEGSISTSDTQAIGSHRLDGDGERCHRIPQVGWRRVHKHK